MPDPDLYYCGELIAPDGLKPVARLLSACPWTVELRRSGYDGTLYLYARDSQIELEMDSGQGPTYLFSGVVCGGERSAQLLQRFSECLARGCIVHRVEVNQETGAGDLSGYYHHGWPEGAAEPDDSSVRKQE